MRFWLKYCLQMLCCNCVANCLELNLLLPSFWPFCYCHSALFVCSQPHVVSLDDIELKIQGGSSWQSIRWWYGQPGRQSGRGRMEESEKARRRRRQVAVGTMSCHVFSCQHWYFPFSMRSTWKKRKSFIVKFPGNKRRPRALSESYSVRQSEVGKKEWIARGS